VSRVSLSARSSLFSSTGLHLLPAYILRLLLSIVLRLSTIMYLLWNMPSTVSLPLGITRFSGWRHMFSPMRGYCSVLPRWCQRDGPGRCGWWHGCAWAVPLLLPDAASHAFRASLPQHRMLHLVRSDALGGCSSWSHYRRFSTVPSSCKWFVRCSYNGIGAKTFHWWRAGVRMFCFLHC